MLPQFRGQEEESYVNGSTMSVVSPLDTFMYIVFFIPFVANPFIYVMSSLQYRAAYRDLFCKTYTFKLIFDTRQVLSIVLFPQPMGNYLLVM